MVDFQFLCEDIGNSMFLSTEAIFMYCLHSLFNIVLLEVYI